MSGAAITTPDGSTSTAVGATTRSSRSWAITGISSIWCGSLSSRSFISGESAIRASRRLLRGNLCRHRFVRKSPLAPKSPPLQMQCGAAGSRQSGCQRKFGLGSSPPRSWIARFAGGSCRKVNKPHKRPCAACYRLLIARTLCRLGVFSDRASHVGHEVFIRRVLRRLICNCETTARSLSPYAK